jgi:integrase
LASHGVWKEEEWRNWRQKIFAPAAASAGLEQIRPYDLRHSFVSLLFAEGRTVIEVARQAGHSPTMALATYGHVIAELERDERRPTEEVIREARAVCPQSSLGAPRRLQDALAARTK